MNKIIYNSKLLKLVLLSAAVSFNSNVNASSLTSGEKTSSMLSQSNIAAISLSSSEFTNNGTLPTEYTCDGTGISPPLSWTGVPSGTAELVLLMTTPPGPGDTETVKYNWVMYHIPVTATSLAQGTSGIGTFGVTSDGAALAYSPPCSKGPGAKKYTFTLYAVSESTSFSVPATQVSGDLVSQAISGTTIGIGSITVSYTRY